MTAQADAKQLTAAEVFAITGLRPEKQYQWDDRGVTVPSRNDKLPSGSGDPHLKSIETVYQLAITAALVRLGVGPKAAACASRKFTDHAQPGRTAGKLFPQDQTLLVLRASGPVVINAPYYSDFADLAEHGTAFVAIDCGKICKEIDIALSQINLKK
jgi:hypothetical protein